MGKPIIIQFYAPEPQLINAGDSYTTIKYDFRAYGEDINMIKNNDDYGYCMKQCLKMCYYIQKMHNIEILKMRCEFAKDDHGTIWFLYANQIFRRDALGLNQNNQNAKMVKYINKEH